LNHLVYGRTKEINLVYVVGSYRGEKRFLPVSHTWCCGDEQPEQFSRRHGREGVKKARFLRHERQRQEGKEQREREVDKEGMKKKPWRARKVN
jgi:hypothetical protein